MDELKSFLVLTCNIKTMWQFFSQCQDLFCFLVSVSDYSQVSLVPLITLRFLLQDVLKFQSFHAVLKFQSFHGVLEFQSFRDILKFQPWLPAVQELQPVCLRHLRGSGLPLLVSRLLLLQMWLRSSWQSNPGSSGLFIRWGEWGLSIPVSALIIHQDKRGRSSPSSALFRDSWGCLRNKSLFLWTFA